MSDLAQQLVAVLGSDLWTAGMRTCGGGRLCVNHASQGRGWLLTSDEGGMWWTTGGKLSPPDLDDLPTVGALWGIAEQVCGEPVELLKFSTHWHARGVGPAYAENGPTKGEALARLILAVKVDEETTDEWMAKPLSEDEQASVENALRGVDRLAEMPPNEWAEMAADDMMRMEGDDE